MILKWKGCKSCTFSGVTFETLWVVVSELKNFGETVQTSRLKRKRFQSITGPLIYISFNAVKIEAHENKRKTCYSVLCK